MPKPKKKTISITMPAQPAASVPIAMETVKLVIQRGVKGEFRVDSCPADEEEAYPKV